MADDVEQARIEAISYAAYRILRYRYSLSVNAQTSIANIDAKMLSLCFDSAFTDATGDAPAAIGNRIADTILSAEMNDGSNEAGLYIDPGGYMPVNDPMVVKESGVGDGFDFPNRWQPLALDVFIAQNGLPVPGGVQQFQTPHWGGVTPFALTKGPMDDVYNDPGPPPELGAMDDPVLPPQLGGSDGYGYMAGAMEVLYFSSLLDPDNGEMIDISPGAHGNVTLGTYDAMGYATNPSTGMPYESNMVKVGDWGRIIAEFWADGPASETPPGHWNVLANTIADNPLLEKRIGGTGPVVSDLEWDVKVYFALNGGMHDASINAWGVKSYYDYVRPISMIRYMGGLGQSSDPMGPSYDPNGLPLVDDLVEVVTAATTMTGQKHEHLAGHEGEIAVYAWGGNPEDPETEFTGAEWILAEDWVTYQLPTFVTPSFAGYVSGHSCYSRSGAEVLTAITGDPFFPGGLYEIEYEQGDFLEFETGPSETITLQYATYRDAADEAGLSRLYGGIHVRADDLKGRIMGEQVGIDAWALAQQYFEGTIIP